MTVSRTNQPQNGKRFAGIEAGKAAAMLAALGLGGVALIGGAVRADGAPAGSAGTSGIGGGPAAPLTPGGVTPLPLIPAATPAPAAPTAPAAPAPVTTPAPAIVAPATGPTRTVDSGTSTDATLTSVVTTTPPTLSPPPPSAVSAAAGAVAASGNSVSGGPGKDAAGATNGGKPGDSITNANAAPRRKTRGEQLFGKFGRDLDITGQWGLHSQTNSVSGGATAEQAYKDQYVTNQDYRNVGPFQNNMDLSINGKIFNMWKINARFSNSRYGNGVSQQFGFDYKDRGTSVNAGTITPHLTGNELVSFSRSLTGIMYSRDLSHELTATGIFSLTKSTPRRGSFQGTGTSGPYYLNATQLIEGSEKVQLNGKDLTAGVDYRIDYYLGQISFLNGLIVNQTDTVTFTYESQAYNTTPGLLAGTRVNYASKTGNAYGLTYVTQRASGAHARNGSVTERFAVIGVGGTSGGVSDSTWKYYLSSQINTGYPVTIKYNNQVLTVGVDYTLNVDLRYFTLKTSLPADTSIAGTTSLSVEYHPVQQSAIDGNRSVLGLDTTLRVAKNGNVALTFGNSQSETGTNTGTGMHMTTNWRFGDKEGKNAITTSLGYQDIGAGFSSIDSTTSAFLQAQKGLTATFAIAPNRYYNIATSLTNSRVANQTATTSTTSTSTPLTWATNQAINTAVTLQFPNLPATQLSHSQTVQNTSGTAGSKSTFSSDQLNMGWNKGIFGLSTGFSHTVSHGQSVFGNTYVSSVSNATTDTTGIVGQIGNGTYSSTATDATSDSSHYALTVTPARWINLAGNLGFSRNKTGTNSSTATSNSSTLSNARNNGLSMNLMPTTGMSISASLTDTTNGQSTAGFYDNAATSSAAVNGTQFGSIVSGQRTRATNFGFQYSPWRFLNFALTTSKSLSLVPGYDNSETSSSNIVLDLIPAPKFHLTTSAMQQKVTYVGGQGNADNKSYTGTATVGPFGKMTFSSTLMWMNYGSATNITNTSSTSSNTTSYVQNGISTSVALRTDYNIGANRSLYGRWQMLDQGQPTDDSGSTTTSGTIHTSTDYRQTISSAGLEIRFNDLMGFTFGYNIVHLTDRQSASYSYIAHSLSADLAAHF